MNAPQRVGPAAARGVVLAVCLGPGGIPKHPVPVAQVGPMGLLGDRQRLAEHGGLLRAVCLLAVEEVRSMERDGVRHRGPGSFGENLLTEGLDPALLRPGDRLGVGPELLLELTSVREPCGTLRKLDRRFPDLMLGRSGFLARVLRGGPVAPGMGILHWPPGAPDWPTVAQGEPASR